MNKLLSAWAIAAFVAIVIGGCGGGGSGGSGVPGNKRAVDLTDAEIDVLCEYLAQFNRTVECPNEVTIEFGGTKQECIEGAQEQAEENPNCGVTVAQIEACSRAIDELSDQQICTDEELPLACEPLFSPDCL